MSNNLKLSSIAAAVVESTTDGVIITDLQGNITFCNRGAELQNGYTAKEIIGKSVTIFYPENELPKLEKNIELLLNGKNIHDLELTIINKNKELIQIALSLAPMKNDEGKITEFVGISRDISDRKSTEEKLLQSEQFFKDISLSLADWIWEIDKNGIYTYCSKNVYSVLGYDSKEIVGKSPFDFMLPKEAEEVGNIFEEIYRQKKPIKDLVNWNITKDGKKVCLQTNGVPLFDKKGNLTGFRGVDKDITERKKSEEFFKLHSEIMNNMAEGVFLIGINDGIIKYSNPKIESMFGYTSEEMIGKHVSILNCPDDRTPVQTAKEIVEVLAKIDKWQGEIHNIKKDGTTFWSYANCSTFNHPDFGKVIVSVQSDITERKKYEKLYLQSQKMEAIGTLAGGIAHDFNNIMMGIFGYISLAKLKISKDHPVYKFLENSELSMERATSLTTQLLTFAKGGDPVTENIRLDRFIEDTSNFDLSGSSIKPVFKYAKDLWKAKVDKGQIQQVFSNLIINARQAMPEGGTLYILLENADISKDVIPDLNQGRYIRITVQDEGAGIDPKHLDKVFDPFFSTKETGRGLGLATVYSIIKKHNGLINIASKLGKGTTFTLYLPASESQPLLKTKQSVELKTTKKLQASKVLVMDDDKTVCNFVKEVLSVRECAVSEASGGKQAIEMYKQSIDDREPFDIVIMDLTIPGGIGGKETVKEFLKINPKVKCIVSSGYANNPVMANYSKYGFKGVITKPYSPSKLLDVLNQVLKG